MMIVVSYHAIRGLAYARTQAGAARDMRYFHIGVLCYVAAEYASGLPAAFGREIPFPAPIAGLIFC